MKTSALFLPLAIVVLILGAIWALGMLAVKSSAISTEASVEMLRLHIEVARMHEALLAHSQQNLDEHLAELSAQVERWRRDSTVERWSRDSTAPAAPDPLPPAAPIEDWTETSGRQ